MESRKFLVYAALITAMVFWAFSFIWTKALLEHMPPVALILVRLTVSSVFLFLLGKGLRMHQFVRVGDRRKIALLALFNPFFYFVGENFAMQYVSPTVAAVMIATIPIFTPLLAYFTIGERLKLTNYAGILLSFLGVAGVIIRPDLKVEVAWQGILFLLLAIAAAAVYALLIKKLSGHYNALSLTVYQNVLGVVYFIPLLFVLEGSELSGISFTPEMLVPILGLAILCSSLAFVFFAYGIQKVGVGKANVFANVIPIFTAFFAYILFDERLTPYQMFGILLVISGLFLSQVSISNPEKRLKNKVETKQTVGVK